MDWDKLRIFQAVADAGSFTHAGESLKLSQSAISRQIGALEEQLGVMLFHRHARGLILTEQGELLYRTARDMAAKVNTAEALLRANQDKPAGRLQVTASAGPRAASPADGAQPRLCLAWLYPEIREAEDRRGTRPASPDHLRRGRPGPGAGRQLAAAGRKCRSVSPCRAASGEQRLRHLS